ncbi:hypothetical protein LshimejAT787_2300140 [Lyophyllum shimeji]|uniref:Uncharacterized protein n=1 Tax=Lyophyllum shimeji TaxID=47721 RepID=A0A9P3Q1I0_LYOSH|nr:hypothetical protein LshimejAT787_2300140 [Lyophyllum shimeji]
MRSNIKPAAIDVLASNKGVVVVNVLAAYVQVAGFKRQSMEVLIGFERAMDKHPDLKRKNGSAFAKLAADLRKDYGMNFPIRNLVPSGPVHESTLHNFPTTASNSLLFHHAPIFYDTIAARQSVWFPGATFRSMLSCHHVNYAR